MIFDINHTVPTPTNYLIKNHLKSDDNSLSFFFSIFKFQPQKYYNNKKNDKIVVLQVTQIQ